MRSAMHPIALDSLVDQAIADAGDDPFRRYRLVPPDFVERDEFAPFWQRRPRPGGTRPGADRVRRRLLFDAVMEFGLQSASAAPWSRRAASSSRSTPAARRAGQHRPRADRRHRRPGHPRR